MDFPQLSYISLDYKEAISLLKEYGVLVITDVLSEKTCATFTKKTIDSLIKLNPEIDLKRIKKTWTKENLPPQVRPGLMQYGYIEPIDKIRDSPEIQSLFRKLYQGIGKQISDEEPMIPSLDRVNIKPGEIGPYTVTLLDNKDWAHLDQTYSENIYECIQGSCVISNTSAAFRCSPKSHKVFNEILEVCGAKNAVGNWCPISTLNKVPECKKLVESVGGKWQIPIPASRGSFVFWLSSTVHSAIHQRGPEFPIPEDPFNGWRIVYYITFRPQSDFSQAQLKKIEKYRKEKRFMNHWNTKVFSKWPDWKYVKKEDHHPNIIKYVEQ